MITLQRPSSFVTGLWMQRQQARVFTQAIQTVYTRWAARNQPWANAFFDEYFLLQRAAPLLEQYQLGKTGATHFILANQWADQFHFTETRRQQLVTELAPVAANFLYLLKLELCAQEERNRNGGWAVRLSDWTKRGQTL